MTIQVPTSLIAGMDVRVTTTSGLHVQLVAAVEVLSEPLELPVGFRDERKHESLVAHAKPLVDHQSWYWWEYTGSANPRWLDRLVINEPFKAIVTDTSYTRSDRGGVTKAFHELYPDGDRYHLRSVTNTFSWAKTANDKYNWSIAYKTVDYKLGELVAGRVDVTIITSEEKETQYDTLYLPTFDADAVLEPSGYSKIQNVKYNYGRVTVVWKEPPSNPYVFFRFKENSFPWGDCERPVELEHYMAGAFTNAFEQVPEFADNNIANMVELASMVYDAFHPERWVKALRQWKIAFQYQTSSAIQRAMKSVWMSYRYAYNTTKADVIQAINTRARRMITYFNPTEFNGIFTEYNATVGDDITCRVRFRMVLNASNMLGMLHHYDKLAGVNISAYKVWDLIPLSFVYDWFRNVGGRLKDQETLGSIADYVFMGFCWSVKYKSTSHMDSFVYQTYARWYESYIPTELVHRHNSTSKKTYLKRIGDYWSMTPYELNSKMFPGLKAL